MMGACGAIAIESECGKIARPRQVPREAGQGIREQYCVSGVPRTAGFENQCGAIAWPTLGGYAFPAGGTSAEAASQTALEGRTKRREGCGIFYSKCARRSSRGTGRPRGRGRLTAHAPADLDIHPVRRMARAAGTDFGLSSHGSRRRLRPFPARHAAATRRKMAGRRLGSISGRFAFESRA